MFDTLTLMSASIGLSAFSTLQKIIIICQMFIVMIFQPLQAFKKQVNFVVLSVPSTKLEEREKHCNSGRGISVSVLLKVLDADGVVAVSKRKAQQVEHWHVS